MSYDRSKPNATAAASKLREVSWASKEGDFLGSEDDMEKLLKVSRPTVRQAARLIESEGLLKVRRGIHGGYFAARPSIEIIERSVSAYLKTVVADEEEITKIADALWVITAVKAAALESDEKTGLIEQLRSMVLSLKEDARWDDMLKVEDATREAIFKLVVSPYIDLIFHINRVFASQNFPFNPSERDGTEEHFAFVKAWCKAKLLELDSIADGDSYLSELAARHARGLYHKRLWGQK